ncbi:hypothetical protein BASA61_001811 [Batrachochytrium salamandrivorans]|nr:hypothetical protein BASA61_001811 [Batrachochytrium salamandrivorans]
MLVERGLNGCCYTSAMTTLNQTNMSFDVNVTVVPPNEGPRVPLTLPPLPGDNTEARSPATGTDTNSTQPGGYPSYNSSYLPANQISAIVFSVVFGVLIMIFIMMIICWRRQYRQELQEEALYPEQLLAAQIADRLAAQYGGDQRVLSTPSKPMTQLHSSRINSSSAISHNSGKLDDRQITHTTSSGPSSTSSSYTEQLPPSVRHSIIQFGDLLDQFQMPQGREMAIPNGNSSSSMGFDMRRVSHSSIRLKDTDVSRRKSAVFSMPSEPFKAISPLVETSDWAESPCSGEETPEHRPSAQQGSQTSTLVRDSTNNTKPGDTVSPLRLLSSAINSPSLTQRSSDSNSTTTSLFKQPTYSPIRNCYICSNTPHFDS